MTLFGHIENVTITHRRIGSVAFLLALLVVGCGRIGYEPIPRAESRVDASLDGAMDGSIDAAPSSIILVTPTSGLMTTERGATATATIVLGAMPSSDVRIDLESSNSAEGSVEPSSLNFTSANWNAPQMLTVTGVDDALVDGNQEYFIATAPAQSADALYDGENAADISLTNVDDETPGFAFSRTSGLVTTESGGTDSFTLELAMEPTDDVTITLSSSDLAEATVSPSSITFTPLDWSSRRTVTATGVDDSVEDGNTPFTIVLNTAESADTRYDALDPLDVSGVNMDNETPGVVVTPRTGLVTSESGDTAMFTVVLQAPPTADVRVPISSNDTSEGTASTSSLRFTPENWNVPQTVTVTGIDDALPDGDQLYRIVLAPATSSDRDYAGALGGDVLLTNLDNEAAGFTVTPTTSLITTELGGTATYDLVLSAVPSADVVFEITSSDTSEGTVSPNALTFTPSNWNIAQTVTVTGVDDVIADGDQSYRSVVHVASSDDINYALLGNRRIELVNIDNESPGVTVTPTSGLVTTEAGGTASFTVVLNSEPSADVSITWSSDAVSEGTVAPTSVTFTSANWSSPQTVTVSGVDDAIADGARVYHVVSSNTTSADARYQGRDVSDVTLTNTDDDTVDILVMPTSGLVTTEAGGTATFSIALATEPTASVSVMLMSSDASEGTVSPTSVVFTTSNWNTPRTVTATGVDDALVDGTVMYTIRTLAAVSADSTYNGYDASDVTVSNTDNDAASVIVTPSSGLVTSESGASATFTVRLASQPSSSVSIGLMSSDATEGSVSPASVVFTAGSWNLPQTVTVTGVSDALADGDVAYSIITSATSSSDMAYDALAVTDVSLTNVDTDEASVTIAPTSGFTVQENGSSATFTVVLDTQPSADVTISTMSSDATEAAVSPAMVTFTTANWNVPQTLTVQGVNDFIDDGDVTYSITFTVSSGDLAYHALVIDPIPSMTVDDDVSRVVVSSSASLITNEQGRTATLVFVLAAQPSANVTFNVMSSDTSEGTIPVATITFTPLNWNVEQPLVITGVDDTLDDGNITYSIVTSNATSLDALYNGLAVDDAQVLNREIYAQQAYVKASNPDSNDQFGGNVVISADGNTMVVSSSSEQSNATGIGGNQANNAASNAGAVYVFVRSGATWTQQAYVKASNTNAFDGFGTSIAISSDGNTLAVGARGEASNATGINGDQANNTAANAGAVYVFTRVGVVWTQEAYIKASNTGSPDSFGAAVALSSDGNTMAVGAYQEQSLATGINGNQADNTGGSAGAVYTFIRAATVWSQQAYIKASNTNANDLFGAKVALSADGDTLAVCAQAEASNATGINGNQADNSASNSGAVYVFTRAGVTWSQQAYIKASNTNANDRFGERGLAISADGNTLAVGAFLEASGSTGINGDQADNTLSFSGAAYVFVRAGVTWSQQAYIKASRQGFNRFGNAIALSPEGDTLVVGAYSQASSATGVDGVEDNFSASFAGAIYVFDRTGTTWTQSAFVKASNTAANDYFGTSVAASSGGLTIVSTATGEQSNATGINGNQADNSLTNAGAAYVFYKP